MHWTYAAVRWHLVRQFKSGQYQLDPEEVWIRHEEGARHNRIVRYETGPLLLANDV
jgi:hypothetical protein